MTANISTSLSTIMRPETARRRIDTFRRRFSQAHYYFAQHAAFPLALTPDLLYRLWASFQRTTTSISLNVPWIAVADLLLSPLCQETDVGYELYEMDLNIRAQLLGELRDNPHFGRARIEELSDFLRSYVQEQLKSPDPVILDVAQSQRWTALAYTRPDQTARELAEIMKILYNNGSLEQVRIASLLETFGTLSRPLAALEGFEPLLTYAQAQAHTVLGHRQSEDTPDRIQQASLQVLASLGINLPTTRRGAAGESSEEISQETATKTDFYISHHIADHNSAQWIAQQLQNEGYTVTWSFEYGPASNHGIDTSSLHTQARYTIALLSPEYISIDNVQKEWTAVLAEDQQQGQNRLLSIRTRECTPQGIFTSIQYLDLVEQEENTAREMLLLLIQQFLNNPIIPSTRAVGIFIVYASEDQDLSEQLQHYLYPLETQNLVHIRESRNISTETNWENEISTQLDIPQLVLLLISDNFLSSDFSHSTEVLSAMLRYDGRKAKLVPILLKPTSLISPLLNKLQPLPKEGQPITTWPNPDDAFSSTIKSLREIALELSANPISENDDDEYKVQELERKARINQDAATYVELGNLYERLRKIDDAIQAYEGARRLQPGDGSVLFALSRLYNDTGAYEQAIAILDQLIELQPEFADAYKQRGLLYRRRADAEYAAMGDGERRAEAYKRAIADFERAVELRPDFEDALGSLGGLYRRLGDFERAAEYYQRLYQVNPSSSYGLGNLASLSWYLGNTDEARNYFTLLEQAAQMRIKEGKDEAYWDYYDLALSQLAAGEIDVARETYAKALEETPAIAQLDAVLSNLYFLQKSQEPIKGLEEIIAMIENAKDVKEEGNSAV